MSSERPAEVIYLDHAATTPVDPEVVRAMQQVLSPAGTFANPASTHSAGRRSHARVERARRQVAELLHTEPDCLVFTSGATESNNLAILGAARNRAHRGRHLITMRTEHKAVLDTFAALERDGFTVTRLSPDENGLLATATLEAAFRDDTQLVSVMHVNNETGVIQDIAAIGAACQRHNILFHCDAAQSAGKLPLDLARLPIDLLSLTAHKFHGPQGTGALYLADRTGCNIAPLMHGGGQERRLRPGTLPIHQIAGFGAAAELALAHQTEDLARLRMLNDRLWQGICSLPGVLRNGAAELAFPGILNVSAADVDGESLLLALEPVCAASGSACNSLSGEPSYVLRALGRDDRLAQSAVRFSFGRTTTIQDIDRAIDKYRFSINKLRSIGPAVERLAG
ncbi:MAG: aminotransferase class V-fold PLP-dependent enzyme [Woeseia sp.]